ncbi:MAG: biotin--[acetyl-CoA-carboxylase] ligase [Siculibacillus sp.]|nr:biotin--[acetyl-CoA-carboxylase] ligase [Siculibacillus sp.]
MIPTSPGGRGSAAAGGRPWRVERFAALPSTNDAALDRARAGDPGNLWIVADRQTSGRGRRGRVWVSESGNLFATALLIDPCPARHLAELPFVAVTAAHRAVAGHVARGAERVKIKWPNDLMVDGRKVAGILLESTRIGDGRTAVAIGIGINCKLAPAVTETPATSLLASGSGVLPEILFDDLAEGLARMLETWDGGIGFGAVRDEWLAHAVGLGAPIRVRLVDGEEQGVFEAIDTAGRLVLRTVDGERRTISAGDVFFPAGAGAE